jgi:hypothetical protein
MPHLQQTETVHFDRFDPVHDRVGWYASTRSCRCFHCDRKTAWSLGETSNVRCSNGCGYLFTWSLNVRTFENALARDPDLGFDCLLKTN